MSAISFWEDKDRKKVNEKLFSEIADKKAKMIREEGLKDKNKISQIRKFYDEVLHWHKIVQKNRDKFENYLPYIKLLRAKVYYARGRNLITESFKDLMENCLDEIKTYEDFEVFKTFFEAFMGFYRYYDEFKKTEGRQDKNMSLHNNNTEN
ncbi:MAG: type III-A CRISPR-associated protein Csm2 [Caldimicrobium sp.]|nr:type III-A CRISPR-associated protein Csm2 [Caldimicrobium sp.]